FRIAAVLQRAECLVVVGFFVAGAGRRRGFSGGRRGGRRLRSGRGPVRRWSAAWCTRRSRSARGLRRRGRTESDVLKLAIVAGCSSRSCRGRATAPFEPRQARVQIDVLFLVARLGLVDLVAQLLDLPLQGLHLRL